MQEQSEATERDLFDPHDMVPDFGEWKVARLCTDCGYTTIHVRSLQKVSHGWVFRCSDCGKIVGMGSR